MSSNILHPRPVRSDRFTWHAPTRTYAAEISDIGGFGRVYADACDEGLTLVSSKHPGRVITFVVDHTEVRDGDILWWDLIPADLRQRRVVDFKVTVFND